MRRRSFYKASWGQQILATGLKVPAGPALDVAGGKMYWADLTTGRFGGPPRWHRTGNHRQRAKFGPGGYGVVLLHDRHRKELSGGFRRTTNNRMEIMAAIAGLQALKCPCEVTIYTDSQYLAESMTKGWARRWRQNGWMRNREEKACNHDLWERLLDACARHKVTFRWLRGHAGNPENERCDQLAVNASQRQGLPADQGYEAERGIFSCYSTLFGDRTRQRPYGQRLSRPRTRGH